jgi:hypothetical protein
MKIHQPWVVLTSDQGGTNLAVPKGNLDSSA